MDSIFRETTISWDGVDYTLVPDMKLLKRIERGRPGEGPVSLIQIASQAIQGNPQISIMAQIIEEVMHAAGAADFTEEVVLEEFYGGNAAGVSQLWHDVIAALSPVPKDQKKADVPDKK